MKRFIMQSVYFCVYGNVLIKSFFMSILRFQKLKKKTTKKFNLMIFVVNILHMTMSKLEEMQEKHALPTNALKFIYIYIYVHTINVENNMLDNYSHI